MRADPEVPCRAWRSAKVLLRSPVLSVEVSVRPTGEETCPLLAEPLYIDVYVLERRDFQAPIVRSGLRAEHSPHITNLALLGAPIEYINLKGFARKILGGYCLDATRVAES